MVATQTTLQNILKEFYIGPVQDQLNNEMMVLELMEKTTVDWNGRVAIIPVHTARNTGVQYLDEAGTVGGVTALPVAGSQGYLRLQVNARFQYGTFQITGPATAAAAKGGVGSFVGWMDAEMKRLVTDFRNASDRRCVSGGRVLGFVNEHENKNANPRTYEFTGDIEKLETVRAAVAATGNDLRIEFIRMDTYATIATWGGANAFGDIAAAGTPIDVATRSFTMRNAAVNDLDLTGLPAGVPCAVRIADAQSAAPATVAADNLLNPEPEGIYGNLANPTHFGIDRTATATGENTLRSSAVLSQASAGNHDRANVSLPRIQNIFDQISLASGEEPDMILMSPLQRQLYGSLFQLTAGTSNTVQNVSGERASKLDGGFSGLSYGGVPIKTARQVDNGGMVFMKSNTWKLLELQGHGFADLDGTEILRANGIDAWEGFYKWYYNTVCTHPNQNGMLVGLTLTA
tara:strand:- start:460 stop:1839 length:1380 start_codon:yes stop_codon:yes gene_type:complete